MRKIFQEAQKQITENKWLAREASLTWKEIKSKEFRPYAILVSIPLAALVLAGTALIVQNLSTANTVPTSDSATIKEGDEQMLPKNSRIEEEDVVKRAQDAFREDFRKEYKSLLSELDSKRKSVIYLNENAAQVSLKNYYKIQEELRKEAELREAAAQKAKYEREKENQKLINCKEASAKFAAARATYSPSALAENQEAVDRLCQ